MTCPDPTIFVIAAMLLGFACGAAVMWSIRPYDYKLEKELDE